MSKDKSHLLRLEHPFLYWQSTKSTSKSSRGVIFSLPFNSYIRHIARLSLLYCYYLGRCSTKLLARNSQNSFFTTSKRVFFLYSCTQRQAELAQINLFFSRDSRLCNALPRDCFSVDYNLVVFKSSTKNKSQISNNQFMKLINVITSILLTITSI